MSDDRPDAHTATGAYALDALPDDERRAFERHLDGCTACRDEVAELQATAARLATLVAQAPPPELRERVRSTVDRTRQVPPPVALRPSRTSAPGWWPRVAAVAAAVVVVAAAGLGTVVLGLREQVRTAETEASQVLELLAAEDTRVLEQAGPDGATVRVVLAPAHDRALLVTGGLAPPPPDRDYQLWLIDGAGAAPAGLLDVGDDGRAHQLVRGDVRADSALGVTLEPRGGSPQPTTEPLVVVDLAASGGEA